MPWRDDDGERDYQRPRRKVCEVCKLIILRKDNLVEVRRNGELHTYCAACAAKEAINASSR